MIDNYSVIEDRLAIFQAMKLANAGDQAGAHALLMVVRTDSLVTQSIGIALAAIDTLAEVIGVTSEEMIDRLITRNIEDLTKEEA